MGLKDLVVAYNGSENADTALQFAVQMCKKYEATLSGLYAQEPVQFEDKIQHWLSEDVLQALRSASTDGVSSIEESFYKVVRGDDFGGEVDWLVPEGRANAELARAARYFDLMLIGQFSDTSNKEKSIRAEDLVVRAGTPIIVVPNGYKVHSFNEYAVVAWDASRSAARALRDAMHILETKKKLDVVTVRSEKDDDNAESTKHSNDIIRHLKRHGVDAEHVVLTADRAGRGAAILEHCAKTNPDVLVMGGYGHARLREELFGGVTKHIMLHMNVPVFMSH